MFFDDNDKGYKLVAPDVDGLLRFFDRREYNPTSSTPALMSAAESLFQIVTRLAPVKNNEEVKSLWLRIPRGELADYASFEKMKEWGEVDTYAGYEARWLEDYPEAYKWYELLTVQSFDREGNMRYYAICLGNITVISATTEERAFYGQSGFYEEEAACKLCKLIIPSVSEAMELVKNGKYNDLVEAELPYQFRTGVIKRSAIWSVEPEAKEASYDGLSEEIIQEFKRMLSSGANDETCIGRIKDFTANDFFRACRIGYESIGLDCEGFSLSDLYMHYADGRDEGLTGEGHGLNAGPGIAFDDPKAWENWYFHREQCGGHPWEVVRGGNSTHVDLFVRSDKSDLEWKQRLGEITEVEFAKRIATAGYYFVVAGRQRQFEAVSFYLALSAAGLPVVLRDADELLARFEATDWIGIVPHHIIPRYYKSLFPAEYGTIIDFTHVYKNENPWFDQITWLPENKAWLIGDGSFV